MILRNFYFSIIVIFALIAFAGCEKKAEKISTDSAEASGGFNEEAVQEVDITTPSSSPKFPPFYIYTDKGTRENHYVPSGFMPDGKCLQFDDSWITNCQSGQNCIRTVFDVTCARENQSWAGIYWLNPSNNWGKRKGGYNLTGAQKLVFWARGEEGGEQIQEFTVGGITGDYPDSDTVSIGPLILSNEWKEYSIDLRGKDLSYISGGFAWTTNVDVNPEKCIFYLDNIRFE